VGAIINVIADREELQVNVDPSIRNKLKNRVSVEVQQASLRHLLDALLAPVGIRYELDGKTLLLLPKTP